MGGSTCLQLRSGVLELAHTQTLQSLRRSVPRSARSGEVPEPEPEEERGCECWAADAAEGEDLHEGNGPTLHPGFPGAKERGVSTQRLGAGGGRLERASA